jgi:TonB family protein
VDVQERLRRAENAIRVANLAVSLAKTPEDRAMAEASLTGAHQFQASQKNMKEQQEAQASAEPSSGTSTPNRKEPGIGGSPDQKQQPSLVGSPSPLPSNEPVDGLDTKDCEVVAHRIKFGELVLGDTMSNLDVVSDTQGVDFGPYLARVLHVVKINWYNLIPEQARPPINKKRKVSIAFAVLKDGRVARMRLCESSGEAELDRAAWDGITASTPFPPLPTEFGGEHFALRFHFYYNPDNCALDASTTSISTGNIDVLSDTQGVDFGPYLQRVCHDVKVNWYNLIPKSARPPINKKGKVAIEIAIMKDGRVAGMRLEQGGSSGDVALDRAAWGSITASDPFDPLPSEFGGQYLALRLHFSYNLDKGDLTASPTTTSSKSGITVKISTPNMLKVPIGGSQVVTATVEGTTNTALKWSIAGLGCSGSNCGTIQDGLYTAPKTLPSPPSVTLTATSETDPIASASITITLTPAKDTK